MESVTSPNHEVGSSSVGTAALGRVLVAVDELRRSVERARTSALGRDALIDELEGALAELRAAGEEVRAQADTIRRLVESREGARVRQERTLAILPVAVVLTDDHGIIRTVNAAAALLMNVRVDRLVGRPIFSCFAVDDRRRLRQLLARRHESVLDRRLATLVPREAAERTVEVVVSDQLDLAAGDEICWILLAAAGPVDQDGGGVTEALAAMALLPQRHSERQDLMEKAVLIIQGALPGPAEVSLVVGSPAEPRAVSSSSQTAQLWDGAQVACGDGPSVLAHRTGATVSSMDAGSDRRWPDLARHAPPERVAVVAAPIQYGEGTLGVLTTYVAGGEPTVSAEVVELFSVAAGGVLHELEVIGELDRLEGDLHRALSSRAVIDQAKGIIMARHGVDAEGAWEHLLNLSSAQHVKVRDLAQRIVDQASRSS